jgi:hypothetical protein
MRLREAAKTCQGIPVSQFTAAPRLGAVALEDAQLAAADFQFLRTTAVSLRQFLEHFDLDPLNARFPEVVEWLRTKQEVLAIREPHVVDAGKVGTIAKPVLTIYDQRLHRRLVLGMRVPTDASERAAANLYVEIVGVDLPATGLWVLSLSTQAGDSHSDRHNLLREPVPLFARRRF